jgi:hypothetical protein
MFVHEGFGYSGHLDYSVFEDLASLLIDIVEAVSHGSEGGGEDTAAGFHVKESASTPVSLMEVIHNTHLFVSRFQEHGSCPIAENNAGGPIRVVYDGRHFIAANHEGFLDSAGDNTVSGHTERIQEAAARRFYIKAPSPMGPNRMRHNISCSRKGMLRRNRSHNNQVNLSRVYLALAKGFLGGLDGHVSGAFTPFQDAALPNARSLHDPLVGSIYQLL